MKILIAEVIYKKNLSLRQVSILTGVPKSTLGKLCNGGIPRLDTLEQIAKGLQVRMQDLYDSQWKSVSTIGYDFQNLLIFDLLIRNISIQRKSVRKNIEIERMF